MRREQVGKSRHDPLEWLDGSFVRRADWREYWLDDVCYVFTPSEIERLHAAAVAMVECVGAAVARALQGQDGSPLERLAVPPALHAAMKRSWRRHDPSLYGRFDFVVDPQGTPKLLEFNADTPTALFEAAVMQWRWLHLRDATADQYNRIHEKLVARFRNIAALSPLATIHFACLRAVDDDRLTTDYLRDCAVQAGIRTEAIDIAKLGVRGRDLVDVHEETITHLFKLYPWEWLAAEPSGAALINADLLVLEPAWRLAASSKMLLADLWQMFPDHENLAPASRAIAPQEKGSYLAKTAFGREGDGVSPATTPPDGPFVYQQRVDVQPVEGRFPVLGVWVVNNEPCGMGVREQLNPITDHDACFVPHRIAAETR